MSTLIYILLFTFIGSIGALIGGLILLSFKKFVIKISHFLASFAAGILLGSAFLDLLPEAFHEAEGTETNIFLWALAGIVLFFLVERFIHWFHHHGEYHDNHEKEAKSTVSLIVVGDTMHNFIDGIVIAATFMVSVPVGIVSALAVFAHEIPQEVGDFGLMLHKGLSKKKIILINILSASAALIGAILTYLTGDFLKNFLPAILALTAGLFIYIAASDLIPEIHHEKRKGFAFVESLLLLLGIVIIWVSISLLEHS